ncbi:porin family protein [Acidobacteria bacterium AH-259-G07]|nr:porin family protein [Acidobacteria bacterium AH-259-G07]
MKSVKQFTGIALFVFTFLLATSQARAQAENFGDQRFLVSGFVGGQIFDLGDELEDAGADIDPEVFFGGRFEYRFSPHFGVEGSVSFSPATADLLGAAPGTGFSASDVDTWDIHGNLVYHILPHSAVDPYVTGGLGTRILDITGGDTESYFAGNFGGGLFVPLSKRFALRETLGGLSIALMTWTPRQRQRWESRPTSMKRSMT